MTQDDGSHEEAIEETTLAAYACYADEPEPAARATATGGCLSKSLLPCPECIDRGRLGEAPGPDHAHYVINNKWWSRCDKHHCCWQSGNADPPREPEAIATAYRNWRYLMTFRIVGLHRLPEPAEMAEMAGYTSAVDYLLEMTQPES